MKTNNNRAILFLYEGDTEKEFYDKILNTHLPKSFKAGIIKKNLKGCGSNVNKKVRGKINTFLHESSKRSFNKIHVIVAHDREGRRDECQSNLDILLLEKEFIKDKSRIVSINEIVATQDLESWLFYDIEGIYKFLKSSKNERNVDKYKNIEATNHKILSQLFHQFGKQYTKGSRVDDFLDNLNLQKIYGSSIDLQKRIEFIKKICHVQNTPIKK